MSDIAANHIIGKSPGQGRWKIGAGILLVGIAAQVALWIYFADDRTFSKMSFLFVWPAALFFLAIWWTFFSAQKWSARLSVWALIIAASVAFWNVYAFDGVDGEMIPRFRYRWEPSARMEAEKYLAERAVPVVAAADTDATLEPLTVSANDWPGFRGPRRDGIVTDVTLSQDWEAKPPKELWRHPVGPGWSGFAIVGEFAFTQEQRGPKECVVCYRLSDGTEVWLHADEAKLAIVEANGGEGPHATPQFRDGRIYTYGGTGLLSCLDARTGAKLWQANTFQDAAKSSDVPIQNIEWGVSGSPLVVDHLVIVNPGGAQEKSLIAYDRLAGKIVWAAGDYIAGYASPLLATIHGVPQVVMFHGTGIAGHDLVDGRELWNHPWVNGPKVNAAQPMVFDDGSVIFGCGYGVGSAKIELQVSADNVWQPKQIWTTSKFRPKFNDFVQKDGYVYGLDDSILTCIDIATGKTKWKGGRYGYGQMLLLGDVLLILSEQGELVQVAATPDGHRELTKFTALDPICWNHLAVGQGKLLVRNGHAAACYQLGE